jgi:hypothetical protein
LPLRTQGIAREFSINPGAPGSTGFGFGSQNGALVMRRFCG